MEHHYPQAHPSGPHPECFSSGTLHQLPVAGESAGIPGSGGSLLLSILFMILYIMCIYIYNMCIHLYTIYYVYKLYII